MVGRPLRKKYLYWRVTSAIALSGMFLSTCPVVLSAAVSLAVSGGEVSSSGTDIDNPPPESPPCREAQPPASSRQQTTARKNSLAIADPFLFDAATIVPSPFAAPGLPSAGKMRTQPPRAVCSFPVRDATAWTAKSPHTCATAQHIA
ncbi:exported hypothetical protein [uncultured Desulfovibrio sp.]|uniref:Uncharacterized protein n=1 Tax=uncultured Desulfovibrio sp. TaxID=167968 RepID=A0A212K3H1_9BACT|nr:exported hypothetical protein [uncultured Desulfovibrio sp.]